jgi:peptidoglycan/LPS O-acetylase OafA/YrhL
MRYRWIDALRGWAIFGVMWTHASIYYTPSLSPARQHWFTDGSRGVQLFYIISAFTLFLSHEKRRHSATFPIAEFFVRRFFRIAPLFYLALGYYVWDELWHALPPPAPTPLTWGTLLSTLTFTNGLFPAWINRMPRGGWSVAIEMSFYLIMPFIFTRIRDTHTALRATLASIFLARGFDFILSRWLGDGGGGFRFMNLLSQLPVFGMGILLFHVMLDRERGTSQRLGPGILLALAGLVLGSQMDPFLISRHVMFGAGFGLLAYGVYLKPIRGIVNAPFVYLGRISYSLYLVNLGVRNWLERWGFPAQDDFSHFLLRFGTMLALSIAFAELTYRCVELPGQRLGRRLIDRYLTPPLPRPVELRAQTS